MTKLIVISAPSGAGKTTLCRRLLKDFPQLTLSISTTTRAPRGNEKEGIEYFFVPREKFDSEVAQNRFAEWALVHGNCYGTSKKVIEDAFRTGRSVLLDIDVQGAESLRKAYPDESVLIFISPPNLEELEKRLRSRGTDNEQTIQKRLQNARQEMEKQDIFDHVVINDLLDLAYQKVRGIVSRSLSGAASG